AVSEGRVHVAAGARLLADLRAGDGARVAYDGRTVRLERGEADAMTAWRRGRVVFRDVPLREVAERFNRLNPLRLHVEDEAAGARRLADLRAGDGARMAYDGRTVRLERGEADAMTAWRRGRVVFRDVPLREVAERFNRLNPLRLHVEDEAAGALRLTGNLAA